MKIKATDPVRRGWLKNPHDHGMWAGNFGEMRYVVFKGKRAGWYSVNFDNSNHRSLIAAMLHCEDNARHRVARVLKDLME